MVLMANDKLVKKGDEVRKAVEAIHTSGNLTLTQRKMVNVLLLNAYDDLLEKKTHELPVNLLFEMLEWTKSNNITLLKQLLSDLATTKVEFDVLADPKKKRAASWGVMSFLSYGGIENGVCYYRYDQALAERFYDPEIYAIINISQQNKFKGNYALNLYENCMRYKKIGHTGWWELPRFRKLVGASNDIYLEFKYLRRDVIAPCVREINKVSDILVEPEYRKDGGRAVTHIRFLVRENPQGQLLKNEPTDEYDEIRKSAAFLKLREHGVGERLAISWIAERGEDRINKVVEYVEHKEQKKLIKKNTAGYIRTVIEDGGELPTDREAKKQAQAQDSQKKQLAAEAEERERIEAAKEESQRKRQRAMEIFEDLSDARKTKLLKTFEGTLAPSNQIVFKKSGVKRLMLREAFTTWLLEKDEFAGAAEDS